MYEFFRLWLSGFIVSCFYISFLSKCDYAAFCIDVQHFGHLLFLNVLYKYSWIG